MPHINSNHLAGKTLEADVCVIGGGPAGIVVATELANEGRSVVVIEAGPEPYDHHEIRNVPRIIAGHLRGAQADARGTNTGNPYFPLRMSRVRGVGGSTRALLAHGLRSRPLDAVDFETGWPISYDDFAAYTQDAAAYCAIPGTDLSWVPPTHPFNSSPPSLLSAVAFRHGRRDRFRQLGAKASDHPNQRWITSAAAHRFTADATGHVVLVGVRTPSRSAFTVSATDVVLAAGGIDNARLLLANPSLLEHMGSAADQVGRNFMEHLHYVAGHLLPTGQRQSSVVADFFDATSVDERWLTIDSDTLRTEGFARTAYSAVPTHRASLDQGFSALGRLARIVPYGPFDRRLAASEIRTIVRARRSVGNAVVGRLTSRSGPGCFAITAMGEQAPNPSSRITLATRRDRYGIPLPVLEWRLSEHDHESLRRSGDLLGRALNDAGIGEFVPTWAGPQGYSPVLTGGWHHMGTTRMSDRPADGVVDSDARVHGVPNLYIAGSSVFPTGGFANPTLSLVALATRLGRYLAR